MKTDINTQAQNEVKELLNQYVVSPLNTDITNRLSSLEHDIQELEKNTGEEIHKISPPIKGNIDLLRKGLDHRFSEIADDINESCEEIINRIDETEKALTGFSSLIENASNDIQSEITKSKEKICGDIKKHEKSIQKIISEKFEAVDSKLNSSETVSSKGLQELRTTIADLPQLIDSKTAESIAEINKNFESISHEAQAAHLETIGECNKIIVSHYNELLNQIAKLEQTISSDFDDNDAKFDKYKDETALAIDRSTSELQELTQKKYKTLFVMSLSFGIANFLGIILMLILYFIK